jgi:surfactin synthase thioesterase subunit
MGAWFRVSPPQVGEAMPVFLLPPAGGSASFYAGWAGRRGGLYPVPVQYPGRENRFTEPPFTDAAALVCALVEALGPFLTRPFALFGHSMGGLLAFETARALRRRGLRAPAHLFVSGQGAPQLPREVQHWTRLPDDAFVRALGQLNPDQPLEEIPRELLELMLPTLRADVGLYENYRCLPEPPLDTPITALGGSEDHLVPLEELAAWGAQTTAFRGVRLRPGHHFYLVQDREAVLAELAAALTG